MTSKNKKLTALFIAGCAGVLITAAAVGLSSNGVSLAYKNNKICEGVTINDLDVGGLTKEEAEKKVNEYIKSLSAREVVIVVDDNEVQSSAEELGFSCEEKDVVEKAYQIGKDGGFFSNKTTLSKEDREAGKGQIELKGSVDENKLQDFVEAKCTAYAVKAKNSKLKYENGTFIATKSRNGRKVKVAETVAVISHALAKEAGTEPLTVEAVVDVWKPKYTQKQVAKCKDMIGTYSTYYGSSTAARASNVKTAAGYIDGTILYPGKTFSTIKTIKERTEENGYQKAPEYSSGNVVEGVGGGVCQVSTTLYNAVINAELEVVERSPHSMVVSYVDVSRDAAISGTYKDFKFKNNTDVPIYIAASADGATLRFRIYGEETRASSRSIKFKSKILETIEPGNAVTTVDSSKPSWYRSVTQSAHIGYKAELWKYVYEDGKQTDKVLLNSSSYGAEPEHITVGKSDQSEKENESKTTEKPATSNNTKATEKPKTVEKQAEQAKTDTDSKKKTSDTKTSEEEKENSSSKSNTTEEEEEEEVEETTEEETIDVEGETE